MKSKIGYFEVNQKTEILMEKDVKELNGESCLIIKSGDKILILIGNYQNICQWKKACELVKDKKIKTTSDLSLLPENKDELVEFDMDQLISEENKPETPKKKGFFSWLLPSSFSSDTSPTKNKQKTAPKKPEQIKKEQEEKKKKEEEIKKREQLLEKQSKKETQNNNINTNDNTNNNVEKVKEIEIKEKIDNQQNEQQEEEQVTQNNENDNDDHSFLLSISERSWENNYFRAMQMKTFLRWANFHLRKIRKNLLNLTDLSDGLLIVKLTEIVSNSTIEGCTDNPSSLVDKIHNISTVISFVQEKFPQFSASASEIVHKNLKNICSFLCKNFFSNNFLFILTKKIK